MSGGYISPGEAWLRFGAFLFVGIGSLGGIVYLAKLF
jgi:hypothetical protein